jgi:hypothetical protein
MAEINELSSVSASELSGADLLVTFSNSNGDSRKISVTNFLAWLNTNFANDSYTVEAYVPTAGQTITVTDDGLDRWMKFIPAGTLATLTVTLPADENASDGQQILVTSTAAVTALTVNGNGATVNGAPSSLSADGAFVLRYNALDVAWYMVAESRNNDFVPTVTTPTTGFTVDLSGNDLNNQLILTPAGTLASGIISIPNLDDARDGQEILVNSTQEVTSLTVSSFPIGTPVSGAPSTLLAGEFFRLKYNTANQTWYRVG